MTFAELIDLYLEVCTDRELVVDHLEELLRSFAHGPVLDCAVGTGFITLELIERGHNIVCADGSVAMLERFKRKARQLGLDVKPVRLDWSELAGSFPDVFDLVICRGNSLVYAGVWDQDDPEADPAAVSEALKSMYGALRPGGSIYVDIPADISVGGSMLIDHPEVEVDGVRVAVEEEIQQLKRDGLRRWDVSMRVNDESYHFMRHSLAISDEELRGALLEAGFIDVLPLVGNTLRRHYKVFTARKPVPNIMTRFA